MMDLDIPERLVPVRDKIDQFVRTHIDPLTEEYYDNIDIGDRWVLNDRQLEIMNGLKDKAREAGLVQSSKRKSGWSHYLKARFVQPLP